MARIGRWVIALITVISLAGVFTPAEAQVVVRVGPHHRHYHHRHYHHHHWR